MSKAKNEPVEAVEIAQRKIAEAIRFIMRAIMIRRKKEDGKEVGELSVLREGAGIVIQALGSSLLDEAKLTLIMRVDGRPGAEVIISTDDKWDLVVDIMRKGAELGSIPMPGGGVPWGERSSAKGG